MQMTLRARTSRRAFESSQSLSASRLKLQSIAQNCKTDNALELELDEEGTRISLTIVDTPGFGDQIDNEARLVIAYSKNNVMIAKPGNRQLL